MAGMSNDMAYAQLMRMSTPDGLDELMRIMPPEHAERVSATTERARDLGAPKDYQEDYLDDPQFSSARTQPSGVHKGRFYG